MLRTAFFSLSLACILLWAAPLSATVVFYEPFNGSTLPTTLSYSAPSNITWSIDASNRLFADFVGTPPSSGSAGAVTISGFGLPGLRTVYSLDVGIPTGAGYGNYNVGMRFGDYYAIFHPGYPQGAFRMEGGYSIGNQNMGYTPAADTLHHMEVTTTQMSPSLLAVDVTISGLGTDLLPHTYTYSFLDTTPNLGTGAFGARMSGSLNYSVSDAFFDNFQVDIVPEPGSAVLLLLGAVACAALRRRTPPQLRRSP